MIIYIARKAATAVVVFLAVTSLTYLLFYARGGDAIAAHFLSKNADQSQIHSLALKLGLFRPLSEQYFEWLGRLFTGSLGNSFQTGEPVTDVLASRLPVTLSLVGVSIVITLVLGVPLGILAATRGGAIDRGLQLLTVAVQAIPSFWLALILAIVFGLTLRLVPATGYVPIDVSFVGWFSTIIVPSFAIGIGSTAFVAAQVRGSMLDVLRQDYIRTLRARGIPQSAVVLRHALRNAAPPTLTILSLQIIALLGGAVIVERIFALPGLGTISVLAGQSGDVPVVLGAVLYTVLVVSVVNILAEVANGFLNPKVRVS